MDKSIPDKKDLTIIAFDKPIIKTFSQNIRTDKMVSLHP